MSIDHFTGPFHVEPKPESGYVVFKAGEQVRLTEDHEEKETNHRTRLRFNKGAVGTVLFDTDDGTWAAWVGIDVGGGAVTIELWVPKDKLEQA